MNSNVLINIPHSSLTLPDDFIKRVTITNEELINELELLTDKYTDDLFDIKDCSIVKANFSRLFCDVERFRDDSKEQMSKIGMGAIYTNTTYKKGLIDCDKKYKDYVLKNYYDPYHRELENATTNILEKYDRCIIIDAHSFSVELVKRLGVKYEECPDICIGFDDDFCDERILNILKTKLESSGFCVKYNYPYSGSIVPNEYYIKKDSRVKSFMIEINKSIYLDNNCKNKQYYIVKQAIKETIENIMYYEKSNSHS